MLNRSFASKTNEKIVHRKDAKKKIYIYKNQRLILKNARLIIGKVYGNNFINISYSYSKFQELSIVNSISVSGKCFFVLKIRSAISVDPCCFLVQKITTRYFFFHRFFCL